MVVGLMTGGVYVRVVDASVTEQSLCGTEKYVKSGQVVGYTLWILSSMVKSIVHAKFRHSAALASDLIQRGSQDCRCLW